MTDPSPMTRARFAALAAAWGADPQSWPEPERTPAHAFLRDHPEAEAFLDAERGLDRALSRLTVPPPPFLEAAIASRVLSRTSVLRRFRAWFAGGTAALAGGLAAGVVLASLAAPPQGPVPPLYGVSVLGASFDAGAEGGGNPVDADPAEASQP